MNKLTAFLFAVLAFALSACSTSAQVPSTSTPSAYEIMQEQLKAQATLEAPTLAAASTATERAWAVSMWTATSAAEMTGTAVMWTPTPSQTPTPNMTGTAFVWTPTPNFTGTVAVGMANLQLTALAAEGESAVMGVQRDRMVNDMKAVTPFVIGFVVLAMFLARSWRWTGIRVIQRDARGDAPLVVDVVDGTVHDADLQVHPTAGTRRADLKALPAVPLEAQTAVTERAQIIDLQTRGLVSGRGMWRAGTPVVRSVPLLTGPNMEARFEVVDDGAGVPVIDEQILKTLDKDWQER